MSVRERDVFKQVRYWRERRVQSCGLITHVVLTMSAGTHHVTEGVAKEDGVTIEKGPVSAPLTGLTAKETKVRMIRFTYRITGHSIRVSMLDEKKLS